MLDELINKRIDIFTSMALSLADASCWPNKKILKQLKAAGPANDISLVFTDRFEELFDKELFQYCDGKFYSGLALDFYTRGADMPEEGLSVNWKVNDFVISRNSAAPPAGAALRMRVRQMGLAFIEFQGAANGRTVARFSVRLSALAMPDLPR